MAISTSTAAIVATIHCADASEANLDAHAVMEKMGEAERVTFISGVVEGLSYARYLRDGKQTAGMKCVVDWFYHGKDAKGHEDTLATIYAAFGKYPDYPPAPILDVLANRACP